MEAHHKLSDYELEVQFGLCTLPKALFTHETHLRLAWIHIIKYGMNNAIINLCAQIKNYARSLGYAEKFNQTLTVAAVKTVNHFIQKSVSNTFQEFITEFPQLKNGFKSLLNEHYGFDIIHPEKEQIEYLQANLLAFE
ncbi:MAG: hypothetical protein ACO1PI_01610 [Bacteroidota bacterium]|jgi:hypothetical protein